MSSDILINSAIGETRLAHVEDDSVREIRLFRDHNPTLVGAIFYGKIIRLSPEFQAAFVDLGQDVTGFLPLTLLPKRPGKKPKDLTTLLHEGQKIIVQVTADAAEDKSVKLTCRLELHSSAVILHPFREGAFVSSRIKDPNRREELKQFGATLDLKGMGLTFRTEAADLANEELEKTARHMIRHWIRTVENRERKKAPYLMAQGPDALQQILRDYGSRRYDRLIFDRPSCLKAAQDWAANFAPDLLPHLHLHDAPSPLFEAYGVEEEIDQMFDTRIPLRSGAWITIEQTEAMVVVDVNMGTARETNDPMKQRLKINFAAAREVFRQIRLRGISGLIVIDFINMSGKADVTNLLAVVDNLILEDPQQVQRSNLSAFGLLELARKASHQPLARQLIASNRPQATIDTQALALLRQALRDAAARPGLPLKVTASPAVMDWLEAHPALLDQFTRQSGSKLQLTSSRQEA
ncbi:ribonuclease E/G [Paremcibacter congregatus]|uniref:ribonuclease E/G n=1 Tax=Paremcibacter congregatus TaxID=2043170 RepID=UPI0030EF144A|tara:strand:- start:769 stop:2163 length:1395 start_codon:yes stop_codon:yes gene_type:complete